MRAIHKFPTQGPHAQWRLHQNYPCDIHLLKRGEIQDQGIEFSRAPSHEHDPAPVA